MVEILWLQTLEEAARPLLDIPLFGSPPAFPFSSFSEKLAKVFELDSCALSLKSIDWIEKENLTKGMGEEPTICPLSLSPLPGVFFLVMAKDGQKQLLQALLTKDGKHKGPSDPSIEEGFFHYALARASQVFNEINPYGNLMAVMGEEEPLPEEGLLGAELSLKLGEKTLWVKLLIPKEVHASFKTHFQMEKPPLLSDPSFNTMNIPLHIEIGSTTLGHKELAAVKTGDLLLLDRCSFDLSNERGTAILALGEIPLFDVRIKDGDVKILEFALQQEVPPMTENPLPPEEEKKEETPQPEMAGAEKEPLWEAPNEQEEQKLTLAKEIPLTLTVEAGRFQMALQKLTQLSPGNVLELGLDPKMGVSLTLGGKCVAKGELVKLGEAIGVKILKIGE